MSLDVYLYEVLIETPRELCLECITEVRDEDESHRHEACVFSANVTHNLGSMADHVGIYYALWRPEELMDEQLATRIRALEDAKKYDEAWELRKQLPTPHASDIIPLLEQGLEKLRTDRVGCLGHEPENRWGTYDGFVPWVEKYLAACREYPNARVRVSR
jgi:hypothetical protein